MDGRQAVQDSDFAKGMKGCVHVDFEVVKDLISINQCDKCSDRGDTCCLAHSKYEKSFFESIFRIPSASNLTSGDGFSAGLNST